MEPATVLVIEDNPLARKLFRVTLGTAGYRVLEAADGRTALDLLGRESVDLILQDLGLPDFDGFDLIRRIRATARGAEIPVFAVSGFVTRIEEARATVSGFDQFLIKPVEPSRLLEAVRARMPFVKPVRELIGAGRRILIADDDPIQRKLLALRLVEWGFRVTSAGDGEEALAEARRNVPDAILSDVMMPRLDGFRFAHEVRIDPRLGHVPVVLFTMTYLEEEDKRLAERMGASAYVSRSPDFGHVIEALNLALELPAAVAHPSAGDAVIAAYTERVVRHLEHEAEVSQGLAQQCSIQARTLSVLAAISTALARATDVDTVLERVLDRLLDDSPFSIAAAYVADGDGALRLRASLNPSGGVTPAYLEGLAASRLLGLASAQEALVTVPSEQASPDEIREVLLGCEAELVLLAPLVFVDERLGVLLIGTRRRDLREEASMFARTVSGQVAHAVALARTMARLRTSEQRFSELVEGLDAIVWEVEADSFRPRFVSRRAETMLGYPAGWWQEREDALVRTIHPEDRDRVLTYVRSEVAAGRDHAVELRVVAADGRSVWCHLTVGLVREGDRPARLLRGVLIDVSERKHDEVRQLERMRLAALAGEVRSAGLHPGPLVEMLNRSAQALVAHVDAALARIWTHDPAKGELVLAASAGMYTHLDGAHARVKVGTLKIGRIAAELTPHFSNEVVADPEVSDHDWARREGLVSFAGYPLVVGGRLVGVLAMFARRPLSEEEREGIGAAAGALSLGIGRKVMEQAEISLQEQFRQSQKMEAVGRLAGGVAHDFNNLLAVITGFSELILEQLPGVDPLRLQVQEIARAAERAAGLTRQLLAFSRRQVLQPVILDLNRVVSEAGNMLRRVIGEDVDLDLALASDLGLVKADPGQVEQVIMNLAVNARDAMPAGGRLTIETQNVLVDETFAGLHVGMRPGRHVLLAVTDSGSGIDPAVLPRIFEPFFTTKETGKGTGLGLSTVYGIVQQSGGQLGVYSEIDRGTTFKVYLPRTDEALAVTRVPSREPDTPGAAKGVTILLVEDEDGVRSVLEEILKGRGYRVLAARDGGEALLIAEQHRDPIPLMVSDIVMPRMSGPELGERVRVLHPETRFLFLSGYTDEAIAGHGVLEPGTPFLQKPFSIAGLTAKVRDVLEGA